MPLLKSIELPTGVALPYAEHGHPRGVPVVLLHGVTDSWRSFEPVLPHLPPTLHAFAVTQRGHGEATRPASGYRTRDFAADIAAFIETLQLDCPVVVGHSMGSVNAMRFAIDNPGKLRGLVLVGSFASFRNNPGIVEYYETGISRLVDPIDPAFARDFQVSTLARTVAPEFLDMVVAESLKVPADVWQGAFAGFLEDDFASELGKIHAPTWIVWGDRDNLCPRTDQDTLLATIAGSRLSVYQDSGHALHWEEPRRFGLELAVFVESLSRKQHRGGGEH
jgi:pimeloyl-ACP methyl ester carboxylesterase